MVESSGLLAQQVRRLALAVEGSSRRVDEYLTQTGVPVATTKVQLQPQYEDSWEIIDRIIITGPTVASLTPLQVHQQITDPGANTAVATIAATPLAGVQYQVAWDVELSGTIAATDQDNFKLIGPGGFSLASVNAGAVGVYPQETVEMVGDGASSIQVRTISAASGVSAVYGAQITATPLLATFTLQLGDRFWNLALPATGILEFSAGIMLSRVDQRILTSSVAGPWSLELTGRADVRKPE